MVSDSLLSVQEVLCDFAEHFLYFWEQLSFVGMINQLLCEDLSDLEYLGSYI